jgi:hypothetical protein
MGDWKVARTRRLESLRYVTQTFLSASDGDFPVRGSLHWQSYPNRLVTSARSGVRALP